VIRGVAGIPERVFHWDVSTTTSLIMVQ
jgi:hypothetical protein